ncbi:Hypothetical predicted protein [Marmota monax]|uniref:Uncharacterized protein n=1 Tax=Marmota monax TaxID=9995 RepID=A0A5E4BRH6_MARMO|nr:Hypothetical predicted protein [Marmota monax]
MQCESEARVGLRSDAYLSEVTAPQPGIVCKPRRGRHNRRRGFGFERMRAPSGGDDEEQLSVLLEKGH